MDYNSVSIRLIAREAGVSIGILYSYFANKQDIFFAARGLYRDEIYHRFLETIEKKIDVSDSLENAIVMVLETLDASICDFEIFHRQILLFSLSDASVAKNQMNLEKKYATAVSAVFFEKFKDKIAIANTAAVTYLLHRILKETVERLLFFPSEISKEEVFHEVSKMLADYLREQ